MYESQHRTVARSGPSVLHVRLIRDALSICETRAAQHNKTKYANAEKYMQQLDIARSLVTYRQQEHTHDYSCHIVCLLAASLLRTEIFR
jgi:hypothetical protein